MKNKKYPPLDISKGEARKKFLKALQVANEATEKARKNAKVNWEAIRRWRPEI